MTKIEEVNLNFKKQYKNIINKLLLMSQAEIIADGFHLTKWVEAQLNKFLKMFKKIINNFNQDFK